ncbi:hypothetical protein [Chitinophaga deserti]|uniref:hypothetical protein n=1 Tax=Chitinophaga deserti TaxID=2164099 RepID=UPI0013008598|nr:hypothetical protein [Chitinophaga deserti]
MLLKFAHTEYYDTVSAQRIRLFPAAQGNQFIWEGDGWEKNGEWQIEAREGTNILHVGFNYAREETYRLTVLDEEAEGIGAFRLKNEAGKEWTFHPVVH